MKYVLMMFMVMMFKSELYLNLMSFLMLWLIISWEYLSLDSYFSYCLVLLTIWLIYMMFSLLSNDSNLFYLKLLLNMLLFILLFAFMTKNFFLFYIFFEFSVVPTFLLIMGWGYNIERLQAGMYMFMYTLFFSLPFLYLNFKFKIEISTMQMDMMMYLNNSYQSLMWGFLGMLVFLVKLPAFLIHLWLPKAHVEAPMIGSMILAGILLKLGGYGLILITKINFFLVNLILKYYLISLSIMGGFMVGMKCLRMVDMKMLIAYSSVSHMGMVLSSILTKSKSGLIGGFYMMLSHGLSSSGLFMGLGLIYSRLYSRSFLILKSSFLITPIFFLFWFLLCALNLSFPPSLNFFSELMMMFSILSDITSIVTILLMMMFITGVYSIYLYVSLGHSQMSTNEYMIDFSLREYVMFFMHIFPLFMSMVMVL